MVLEWYWNGLRFEHLLRVSTVQQLDAASVRVALRHRNGSAESAARLVERGAGLEQKTRRDQRHRR